MDRRRCAVVAAAFAGSVSLAASAAAAPGPKDKIALRLDGEALGQDYLETNFIKAEKKLQQALSICGPKSCSVRVVAQLYRDLAVVHVSGLGKVEAGKVDLQRAVELDPDLQLDPDYATPELKKLFTQVHPGKRGKGDEPKAAPTAPSARPGIGHTAVTEQAVATPIPIFATWSGPESPKLRLWYKGVGSERWAALTMTAASTPGTGGGGFTGEIPCSAAPKTGEVAYFIEALSDADETLAKDGSRTEPHLVAIQKELSSDPPHLPDASPPDRCKDVCTGDDCGASGEPSAGKRARNNWLSISLEQDLSIIGSGTGVCSGEIQVLGSYSCFRAAGSQYHGNPLPDPGDNVHPGLAPATTRLLIGYDRVLYAGLVLGARLGYVLRGLGPRADGASAHAPLAFHVEGRLAYWFGSDVFSTDGFRPFIYGVGGLAQVDTHFGVVVHEDPSVPPPPSQIDNPPSQSLDAYRRMGQAFVGGGGGLLYAFTPSVAAGLDAKFMHLLPTAGNVVSPSVTFAVGF